VIGAGRLVALLGLLTLGACSDPDPLCDICTTSAIIYGRVLDAGGSPVAGTEVLIEARRDSCTSAEIPATSEPGLLTALDGTYRARLIAATGNFTACPRVTVGPSGSPGPITVDGAAVEFLPDFGSNQRRDSVRVDVEVP
jgi:hypothetical protein